MKTAEEILRTEWNEHDSQEDNLQLAITLNPDVNKIIKAMQSYASQPSPVMSAEQVEEDAINSRFDNDKFIENVCLSYNHGFGLMAEQDKQALRLECKEWMRAIKNNWKYHVSSPSVNSMSAEQVEEDYILRTIDTDKWYWCKCESCGWEDSSEFTNGGSPIADTGDHTDPCCPVCSSTKLDGDSSCDVPQYSGVIKVKIPYDVYMKPYIKAVEKLSDIEFDKMFSSPSVKADGWVMPNNVTLKDIKAVRDYFGEHDKTIFEHRAFAVMNKLVEYFAPSPSVKADGWVSVDKEKEFQKVLKCLKNNKVMVDTREDGIYIRLAGRESEGEAFTLHFALAYPFPKLPTKRKQQIKMNWIEINKKALPQGEVLAANFKAGSYGYKEKLIGYLSHSRDSFECESNTELLENCTHYIDINKHDIESYTT